MKYQKPKPFENENIYALNGSVSKFATIFFYASIFIGIGFFSSIIFQNIQFRNFSKLLEFAPYTKTQIVPLYETKKTNKGNASKKPNIKNNIILNSEKDYYSPQKIKFNKNGNFNIGVFGDSMADGAWSGLYREIGARNYGLFRFSTHSIGLANYEYFDIAKEAEKSINEKSIQVAIIMVGTNDQRGINGRGLNVGYASPKWERNYEARISELIKTLKSKNIAIYWVGLPKMRDKINDVSANRLNQLFYKQAKLNNISFISTIKASSNEKGEFSMRLQLPNEKAPRNLRKSDGIHFEMDGYRLLAPPIIKMINLDLAKNNRQITIN